MHSPASAMAVAEGNLADARKQYEQALTIRRDLDGKGGVAESEMDRASLAIEEGHAVDAKRALPAAIEEARQEG